MNPVDLIATSLLLGGFAAAGGAYGVLLCLGFALRERRWRSIAFCAYAVQSVFAIAVIAFTPLDWWWKLLVAVSCGAYYFIPPMTWRYLIALHRLPEESSR